ncbi:MAG TPA: L,D-transpeptidase family protein [Chryseosolibacter sp.]
MKLSFVITVTCLPVIFFSISGCGKKNSGVIDTVACPIAATVDRINVSDLYFNRKVRLKTKLLYGANGLNRVWLNRKKPRDLYKALVREIHESAAYGFDPGDYHIGEIETAVEELYENKKRTPSAISTLDIRITATFFLFTTHLIEGRIRYPGAKEFLWTRGMPLENDIVLLMKMENAKDLRKVIEHLQPSDPQYQRLQKALAEYRRLEPQDTLPPLPRDLYVKPGELANATPLVRDKLRLTGYKSRSADPPELYDDELANAIREFQRRHGLTPDGIIGGETVSLLNTPITHYIELIVLNLERMRWYPHTGGNQDEIVINVPEYMLRVYRNGAEKLAMRVVLGSEYYATPVFHDTLKYIVFSPEWMVPQSIFTKEFFPRLKANPASFDSERFRFYKNGRPIDPLTEPWSDEDTDSTAYRVVENPGDENSLGRVKFIMPNDFSIYLHDTPAVQLFNKEDRAYSHGCIRVEKPVELAAYLLSEQKEWDENAIKAAMQAGKPLQVTLTKPYPVYIIYRTVWVGDDHELNFRKDVYGHDERHLARLK